jgi:hypothetical protein
MRAKVVDDGDEYIGDEYPSLRSGQASGDEYIGLDNRLYRIMNDEPSFNDKPSF